MMAITTSNSINVNAVADKFLIGVRFSGSAGTWRFQRGCESRN